MGAGFPDFVMFKKIGSYGFYELQFVECKTNNILSKEEKLKMNALRDAGHKCYVAFLAGRDVKCREFLGYENKTR